jgi:L-rhamnose mutarotase
MIRRAFTMKLKPGATDEYIRHHDSVPTAWPQLVAEIKSSGIASITTFQNGLDLFLFSEIANEEAWDKLWNSPVHKKWAELMQPLMHMNDEGIVEAGELEEIFHLETDVARSGK